MSQTSDNLVVRQHERHACAFDVSLASRTENVVLAQAVGVGGVRGATVSLSAALVDLSLGGLGLQSEVYLPKRSQVLVRLELPERVVEAGESPTLEALVSVQRAVMSDRRPSYYLGTAFVDPQGVGRAFSERLLRLMQAEQSTPTAAGAAGRGMISPGPGATGAAA